jgi:hypothetical protein
MQEVDASMVQQDEKEEEPYAHSPLDASSVDSVTPVVIGPDDPFASVFLSVGEAEKFITLIMMPICNGVMKPATRGATDLLLDSVMTTLGNLLFYSIIGEVGPDLTIMLGVTVGANLTNILQDSLTFSITRTLVQAVVANVVPYLSARVTTSLPGPIHTVAHAILEQNIPARLERTLPVILVRVLGITLTHALTRSISHVVVPSISHSLGLGHAGSISRPKAYYEICMRCYMQSTGRSKIMRMSPPDMNPSGYDSGVGSGGTKPGSECGACPTSTYSMYYGIYHAAYYTDYYGEYYAEYYSQAMQMTDEMMYKE